MELRLRLIVDASTPLHAVLPPPSSHDSHEIHVADSAASQGSLFISHRAITDEHEMGTACLDKQHNGGGHGDGQGDNSVRHHFVLFPATRTVCPMYPAIADSNPS